MDTHPIEEIIDKMQRVLYREKPPRLTALRGLQKEQQNNPFKVLVGTILSARTRDENTTRVIADLFSKFKTPKELYEADLQEIKKIIHSIGFYNVKAIRIQQISKLLLEKFNGNVPDNIEQLLKLPGVGRKTANCVLVYGFNKPAIPVDIHVHRISNRLGIVNTNTPEQTEMKLEQITNEKSRLMINDTFVMYGQNICLPRNPKCAPCELKEKCKFYQTINKNIMTDIDNKSQIKKGKKREKK